MTDLSIEELIKTLGFEQRDTYGFFENGEFKEIKFYRLIINGIFFNELNKIKDLGNYKILYVTYDNENKLLINEYNKYLYNDYKESIILVNKEEKLLKFINKK